MTGDERASKTSKMLKPCIQCEKDWNQEWELIDTLYPSERDSFTGEFIEWNIVCQTHNGGCGRIVYGNSKKNAIERWNAGKIDENLN